MLKRADTFRPLSSFFLSIDSVWTVKTPFSAREMMRRLKNAFSRFIYGLCLEDQREEVREIERQRKWSIDPRPAELDCWAVIYTLIVSTELIYRAFSIESDHAEEFKIAHL